MAPPADQNCPYEAKVEKPKVAYAIIGHLKTMGITALLCVQGDSEKNGYYSVELNEAGLVHLLDIMQYQRQQQQLAHAA